MYLSLCVFTVPHSIGVFSSLRNMFDGAFLGGRDRFNDQLSSHIETSQFICSPNQLTVFCTRGTIVVKELTDFCR